jgi:hypothetical protein
VCPSSIRKHLVLQLLQCSQHDEPLWVNNMAQKHAYRLRSKRKVTNEKS